VPSLAPRNPAVRNLPDLQTIGVRKRPLQADRSRVRPRMGSTSRRSSPSIGPVHPGRLPLDRTRPSGRERGTAAIQSHRLGRRWYVAASSELSRSVSDQVTGSWWAGEDFVFASRARDRPTLFAHENEERARAIGRYMKIEESVLLGALSTVSQGARSQEKMRPEYRTLSVMTARKKDSPRPPSLGERRAQQQPTDRRSGAVPARSPGPKLERGTDHGRVGDPGPSILETG